MPGGAGPLPCEGTAGPVWWGVLYNPAMNQIESDIAAVQRITAVPTILKVVSEVTGMRLALIARVTKDSWTACATLDRMNFGLKVGDQLAVATTLCSEVRDSLQPLVVEHAALEPDFCNHPTTKMYGFASYLAFPIYRSSGEYFGNLCALDAEPATLRDDKILSMMKLFAELVSLQLTAEEEHSRDRDLLAEERRTAEMRENFIAVLGHDLRTPLTSIVAGSDVLLLRENASEDRQLLEQIRGSAQRITRLVTDLVDFARGRLGQGIPVDPEEISDLGEVARQIVAEIETAAPGATIRLRCEGSGTLRADRSRVGQLMSNLVSNAVEHSEGEHPVEVVVEGRDDSVRFAVTNRGEPIPPEVAPQLFQPFFRGSARRRSKTGLGLGLYIASQIARSHGGTIRFSSSAEQGTTFTVSLPREASPPNV